jgi:hypothetical protein
VAVGADNTDPRRVDLTVAPGSWLRLPDVLAAEFGFEGAAALVVDPGDSAIMVSSRTYDDAPNGTYGHGVPGMRASVATHAFETERLIQLRHNPRLDRGFRTNIGLVGRCDEAMEVWVDLFRGTGERLGRETTVLQPRGAAQLNNVFAAVTDDSVDDGFAVLGSPTPRCVFHSCASVVDNRTNDPILVPVEPWTTGPEPLPYTRTSSKTRRFCVSVARSVANPFHRDNVEDSKSLLIAGAQVVQGSWFGVEEDPPDRIRGRVGTQNSTL